MALLAGAGLGVAYGVFNRAMAHLVFPANGQAADTVRIVGDVVRAGGWDAFLFALLATVGGVIAELLVGEREPVSAGEATASEAQEKTQNELGEEQPLCEFTEEGNGKLRG
jgi:hypothetical protein